jgi:hypothetical protein
MYSQEAGSRRFKRLGAERPEVDMRRSNVSQENRRAASGHPS